MNIAILIPYIGNFGGGQKAISEIASYLSFKGHNIEFFTQKIINPHYDVFDKFKINLLKPQISFLAPFVFLFKKIKGFDILLLSDFPTNLSSLLNKNCIDICYTPKREFYDLKDYYFKKRRFLGKLILLLKILFLKWIDNYSVKKCKGIISISKNVKSRVEKYYHRKDSIIRYCGINYSDYYPKKYENYVLSVSRFVDAKRVDLAIKAMGYVKNKKVKLYVIGEGPEEKYIKNIAQKFPNVKIIGRISEEKLRNLYANCLAVVYIPINEDWGLVPIEAAASKKPTIGANEGGLKETIINNRTGFLIDNINEKKIAEKIDYLMENKSAAKKLGINAYKYCKQFDWNRLLPQWEKTIIEYSRK